MTANTDIGDLLSKSYTNIPNDSDFDEILSDSSVFSLSAVLNLPQNYLNRQGRVIVIRGKIATGTKEHANGFSFYSSEEEFFSSTGRLNDSEETNGDLVSSTDQEYDPSYPSRIWIHPDHQQVTSFFRPLKVGELGLTKGCHYINRMGFVVKITESNDTSFTGDNLFHYNEQGQLLTETMTTYNLPSMYDLVYVIKNWSLFSTADWSNTKVVSHDDSADFIPEEFDPTQSSRDKKQKQLFDGLIKLHCLAKELNLTFGFHLNLPDGTV